MTFDTSLEARIDTLTAEWSMTKQRMFGSQAYFMDGGMAFAVRGDGLLFRPDDAVADELAQWPGVEQAVMGQRVMKHWLQAEPPARHAAIVRV